MPFDPLAPSIYGKGLYGRGLYSASHVAKEFEGSTQFGFDGNGILQVAGNVSFEAAVDINFSSSAHINFILAFNTITEFDFGTYAAPYLGPYWAQNTNTSSSWDPEVNSNDWTVENNFPVGWVGDVETDDIRHAAGKCSWSKVNG